MNPWATTSPTQIDPFVTYTHDKAGNVIAAHCCSELRTARRVLRVRRNIRPGAPDPRAGLEALFA